MDKGLVINDVMHPWVNNEVIFDDEGIRGSGKKLLFMTIGGVQIRL